METTLAIKNTAKEKFNISVLSLGHMINDVYMNQIQVMLPYLILAGISVSKGAFLVSVFTITSSLVQPFFGFLSDKKNKRWLVYTGTLWMAALLCLTGVISYYPLLLAIVSLAGLGTAAFHPQGSALVAACSGKNRNFAQAVFIAAGNVGWALTPLMAVPLLENFGLKITPVFILPGLLISILLAFSTNSIVVPQKQRGGEKLLTALKGSWAELGKLMLVVAFRSLTYFSMISFLPLYMKAKGMSLVAGSRLVFLMLFTGSIGGLIGGLLADKFSGRAVIIVSLILAAPFFYLFSITEGALSLLLLALAGAFLLASFSVTVTLAQKTISKNAALASGLTLGFGTGIGGLGVGLIGLVVENFGINPAINILIWLPLFAGVFGFFLKKQNN